MDKICLPQAINKLFCGLFTKASFTSNPKEYYQVTAANKLQFIRRSGTIYKDDLDIDVKVELANNHRVTVPLRMYD